MADIALDQGYPGELRPSCKGLCAERVHRPRDKERYQHLLDGANSAPHGHASLPAKEQDAASAPAETSWCSSRHLLVLWAIHKAVQASRRNCQGRLKSPRKPTCCWDRPAADEERREAQRAFVKAAGSRNTAYTNWAGSGPARGRARRLTIATSRSLSTSAST